MVISIIGLLASVILTATVKSRQNAEDNILIQNVTELSKAMDLFYQDYGYYPYTGMTDPTPCNVWATETGGAIRPHIYCILGAITGYPAYYDATNNNGLANSLQPYLPQLPPQLTGTNKVSGTITLWIFDQNYIATPSYYIRDFQSNTCYEGEPNSYMLWSILNNRQTQTHLNGINSHGYILKGSNMPIIPCP